MSHGFCMRQQPIGSLSLTGLSRPTIPETVSEEVDKLEDEHPVASLSVDGKRSLTGLLGVQLKQTRLQQEFKQEVFALEKKYLERTKPLFERRTAIISGSAASTSEEFAAGQPLAEELGYLDGEKELGFKLKFYFELNGSFEDEVVEKTYMNRVRLMRKAHPVESLFSFFSPPPPPPPEEEIDEDNEDAFDARAEIESRLELDYQIGEDIRDRFIPRAIDYFTGKALEFDVDDLDSDEYSDNDFEDDESDVEDVPGHGRHRHAAKGRGAGKKGEIQEECKQQ
ncbi:uncharacterized protein FOMMEDRAFT_30369 [Fomitiporia mediterranea MF3/22]|uniref:uncharacterized protein n=1 Tax=Fomitiporia mediterranea (strain MF3/22) TaxID=694068 RepID=UPI0004407BE1|nr:uncharacterized protein FOMMEDRAFT_30369 [Fomitiporia mediterranea MF3/22]EJD01768.1 hypothetical protein FOMMEDRAFT_30369 [Fomitiporia mediterranea MF3/22]